MAMEKTFQHATLSRVLAKGQRGKSDVLEVPSLAGLVEKIKLLYRLTIICIENFARRVALRSPCKDSFAVVEVVVHAHGSSTKFAPLLPSFRSNSV